MGNVRPRLLIAIGIAILVMGLCLVPVLASNSSESERAERESGARGFSIFYLDPSLAKADVGSEAAAVAPEDPPAAVSAPAPAPAVVGDAPAAEEPDAAVEVPDEAPVSSAIDPDLAPASNLVALYEYMGWGASRTDLSWVVAGTKFDHQELLRWRGESFPDMSGIYYQLAAIEPSALPYAQDFEYQMNQAAQPGLTFDEREAIIEAMEDDADALHAILSATPSAGYLWDDLVALTDLHEDVKKKDKYKDIYNQDRDLEHYFMYTVLTVYKSGDSSPPSNSEILFAYDNEKVPPAQPTGFIATAYDPGVGLEWNPNTETDLAGYDVYLVEAGTPVKLNSELITTGTEYFHYEGLEGATYQVVAVNNLGYESTPAETVSVLAPATVYNADNPAWQFTGQWVRENYTHDGGGIIRVAHDMGSRASITFTGRRVKLFVSTYWQSGSGRIYVDGEARGDYSLYSFDIAWGVEVFVITGLDEGPHTFTLEALGSGGPEGKNYVNIQYAESR